MADRSHGYGEKAYQKKSVLKELYIEQDHSLQEVAEILDTKYHKVYKWYDKHGIEKTDEDRFNNKYEINDGTGCWEWTAATDDDGYGVFTESGEYVRAHRYSYKLHNGEIPKGLFVLHDCHNPGCVNPDHLHTGDGSDNMQDAIEAGRFPDTEQQRERVSVLDKDDVIEIRQRYKSEDITQTSLADEYGVELPTVCDLLHGRTWSDVDGPLID